MELSSCNSQNTIVKAITHIEDAIICHVKIKYSSPHNLYEQCTYLKIL